MKRIDGSKGPGLDLLDAHACAIFVWLTAMFSCLAHFAHTLLHSLHSHSSKIFPRSGHKGLLRTQGVVAAELLARLCWSLGLISCCKVSHPARRSLACSFLLVLLPEVLSHAAQVIVPEGWGLRAAARVARRSRVLLTKTLGSDSH